MKYLLVILSLAMLVTGCSGDIQAEKSVSSNRLILVDSVNLTGFTHVYIIRDTKTNKEYIVTTRSSEGGAGICPL